MAHGGEGLVERIPEIRPELEPDPKLYHLFSLAPIAAAFQQAGNIISDQVYTETKKETTRPLVWHSSGTKAQDYLASLLGWAEGDLANLSPAEIDAMASFKAADVDKFFKKHGIPLKCPRLSREKFGIGGICLFEDALTVSGKTGLHLATPLGKVEAFRKAIADGDMQIVESAAGDMVRIRTRSGDMVNIVKYHNPIARFEMINEAADLISAAGRSNVTQDYSGAILPSMNLAMVQVPVNDLVGLFNVGGDSLVRMLAAAGYAAEFSFGPTGLRFKAGFVGAIQTLGLAPKTKPGPNDWVADDNLLVIWSRPKCQLPLACAWVPMEHFSPKDVRLPR